MLKLLVNYYSPTATEVAIRQRSSKLFLPKYHILDGGSTCRLITACCILSIKYFVWYIIIFPRPNRLYTSKYATQSTPQPMPKFSISPIAGNNRNGISMSFFVVITLLVLKVQNYTFIFNCQTLIVSFFQM